MDVEPGKAMICLGDMNGRLSKLEPHIMTDHNGDMREKSTTNMNLHHLNQTEECIGTYTYVNPGKQRSANDHILVNNYME